MPLFPAFGRSEGEEGVLVDLYSSTSGLIGFCSPITTPPPVCGFGEGILTFC